MNLTSLKIYYFSPCTRYMPVILTRDNARLIRKIITSRKTFHWEPYSGKYIITLSRPVLGRRKNFKKCIKRAPVKL
jgi:hypothetical protein